MESAKHIELLKKQIEKLKEKDFDLEAWKSSAISILERMFGEESHKIEEIKNIRYEHGSWALRDTSGKKSNLARCKQQGEEIIEAAITELEYFGLPSKKEDLVHVNVIINQLENELKVLEYKKIREIVNLKGTFEDKHKKLSEFLKKLDKETLPTVLSTILLEQNVSKQI